MATAISTILDSVMLETGFRPATSYAGTQQLQIANRSASILRGLPLTKPRKTGLIAMTVALTYSLPTDFLEYIPDTCYIDGNLYPVMWPTDADYWALVKAGNIQPGAVLLTRVIGGLLHIHNPVDGSDLQFEYLSKFPITDAAGTTPQEQFLLGTDLWQGDDTLLEMDIRWRWGKAKGRDDWQADFAEFTKYKLTLIGREFGAKSVSRNIPPPIAPPYTNLWR